MNRCLFFPLVIVCAGACAGDLESPDRFDYLKDSVLGDSGIVDPMDDPMDDPMNDPMGLPEPPACVATLFEARCGTSICHAADAGQIDLLSPGLSERLLDQPGAAAGACADSVLVASDGSGALLVDKLMMPPPCGATMPITGGMLSADEMTCVMGYVTTLQGGQ